MYAVQVAIYTLIVALLGGFLRDPAIGKGPQEGRRVLVDFADVFKQGPDKEVKLLYIQKTDSKRLCMWVRRISL